MLHAGFEEPSRARDEIGGGGSFQDQEGSREHCEGGQHSAADHADTATGGGGNGEVSLGSARPGHTIMEIVMD